jgi:RimK family alpha-L-glutamate ligase
MSVLIYTDNPTTGETGLVQRELINRGITGDYKAPWDIDLPGFNAEYALTYVPSNMLHRGSTFELVHRMLILRHLEENGVVVNPVDSMLNYSKEHLTLQLNKLGLPHPETLITENIESAREFTQSLLDQGKEVVLKPIALSRGTGVTKLSRIRSRKDLTQYLVWYTRNFAEGVYYLQEFVPNKGHDIRIFIIDGRVVGREMRSNPDDFRYNVATGGSATPFEEDAYDELAIKVAEAAGLKITGLDILPREDGSPIVLEANCYPGYKALMETTGVPIHELIVDYFQSLLKS